MDVTKLSDVFSSIENVQVEVFSPEHTQAPILDVTDVVSLSGENKNESRQELIEETLLLSLMDRMQKLEGAVERLEQMTAIPYHPVPPSPMSQAASGDDTGGNQGGLASSNTFTPVPVTQTSENSSATSPQAQADLISSKYSSVTSSLHSSIGKQCGRGCWRHGPSGTWRCSGHRWSGRRNGNGFGIGPRYDHGMTCDLRCRRILPLALDDIRPFINGNPPIILLSMS